MKSAAKEEEEILDGLLAEDLEAHFERLVRHYEDRLYSFALRLTGNAEDAEEIAQDAFVRSYRALQRYPAEQIRTLALRAWLYRITLNVARNRRRGKRLQLVSIGNPGDNGRSRSAWDVPADPEDRPDSRYERAEKRADIATLVARLPDRYRAPLILRYVEGLPLEEVASILKQPVGTAKSNVHRAINALRTAISESRRLKR